MRSSAGEVWGAAPGGKRGEGRVGEWDEGGGPPAGGPGEAPSVVRDWWRQEELVEEWERENEEEEQLGLQGGRRWVLA